MTNVSKVGNVIQVCRNTSYPNTWPAKTRGSWMPSLKGAPKCPTLICDLALRRQARSGAKLGRDLLVSQPNVPDNWPLQRTPGASLAGAADRPVRYADFVITWR